MKDLAIIINGSATSGKDTFVEIIRALLISRPPYIPVHGISTVDKYRRIIDNMLQREIVGGEKDSTWRQAMHSLKMLDVKYNNGPITETIRRMKKQRKLNMANLFFLHCREPEEIKKLECAVREKGINVRTLLIRRRELIKYDNFADKNVEKFKYDVTINNDGSLEELKDEAFQYSNYLFYVLGIRE